MVSVALKNVQFLLRVLSGVLLAWGDSSAQPLCGVHICTHTHTHQQRQQTSRALTHTRARAKTNNKSVGVRGGVGV